LLVYPEHWREFRRLLRERRPDKKKKEGRPHNRKRDEFCEAALSEMAKGCNIKTAIYRAQEKTGYRGDPRTLQVRVSEYMRFFGGRPQKPTKP
jgi:hypothetical protein